jgi:hypothetical protein
VAQRVLPPARHARRARLSAGLHPCATASGTRQGRSGQRASAPAGAPRVGVHHGVSTPMPCDASGPGRSPCPGTQGKTAPMSEAPSAARRPVPVPHSNSHPRQEQPLRTGRQEQQSDRDPAGRQAQRRGRGSNVSPPTPKTLFRMFDRGTCSVLAACVCGVGIGDVRGKGDTRAAEPFWKERAARSPHDDRRPDREHAHANHWHGNYDDRFHLLWAGVPLTYGRSPAFLA